MEELAKLEEERGTERYVSEDRRKGKSRSRETLRGKDALALETGDRARYFKKVDEEGRKIMSKIIEQLLNEEKIEAAKRMLERGKMTKEEIAEDLDLPLSVVERLENDLQLA